MRRPGGRRGVVWKARLALAELIETFLWLTILDFSFELKIRGM